MADDLVQFEKAGDEAQVEPGPGDTAAGSAPNATALISDIHANLEALTTVLADIEKRGISRILCLGDIIGYGPDPCACIDLVAQKCEWALMGNHDFAVLYEPTSFNPSAESAAFWTRQQFELEKDPVARRKRWEYLGNLKIRERIGNALYVHASPRRPINEYIFPDDVITAPSKMAQIFDRIEHRCFVGHTHVAGVFTDEPDFYPPADLDGTYHFSEREKCIINPGSVGQPRDRDPRASYAVLFPDRVEFVRIAYDIQAVIDKVKKIDDLSDFLGLRLLEGR
ncbi:MAG: metallophosphoesterase family protein [Planctomycetota bacterium]|nr:metallophosphoesterase family protein [Planctomycetota bacterium]